MRKDDPRFSEANCRQLAENIADYLDAYTYVFAIPKNKKNDKKFRERQEYYQKKVAELIKKLRNGNTSVFKDPDEVDASQWINSYMQ